MRKSLIIINAKTQRIGVCNACESFTNPNACPTNALTVVGQEYSTQEIINKVLS